MAFPLIATSMVAARVTGGFYLFLSDRTRDPHEPDYASHCGNACAFSLSPRDDRHFPGTSNPYCFSKVIVSGRFIYERKPWRRLCAARNESQPHLAEWGDRLTVVPQKIYRFP